MDHFPYELRDRKFRDRVLPFDGYQDQKSNAFLLLHEALIRLEGAFYQSPRWDHEPSQSEQDLEQETLEECDEKSAQTEALARNLYFALTGNRILQVQSDTHPREIVQVEQPK